MLINGICHDKTRYIPFVLWQGLTSEVLSGKILRLDDG